jgi:hypothetical protein
LRLQWLGTAGGVARIEVHLNTQDKTALEASGGGKFMGNINRKTRATKHFSFHFPLAIFILATTCVALSLSLQARYELKIVEVFA